MESSAIPVAAVATRSTSGLVKPTGPSATARTTFTRKRSSPFAHQVLTDHLTGKTGGRSERGMESNTCPKRFEVNTSNEYWCNAASLLHTDTQGNDLPDPENVKFFLLSGLSHSVGNTADRKNNQQFTNGVAPYAAHRALLVALDEWVSQGIAPPESQSAAPRQRRGLCRIPARVSDRIRAGGGFGLARHSGSYL